MREGIKVKLLLNIFEEVTKKYEELLRLYEQMNEFLEYQASHDPLTGLYNRAVLEKVVNAEIAKAKFSKETFSLIFIDLDNFKALNDTYGHQYGDEILKRIGEILRRNVRKNDIVARYGGDEFILLIHSKNNFEPEKVAKRIKKQVEQLLKRYNISISYGIAVYGKDGYTFEELIGTADRRMYEQKIIKKLKGRVVS